MPEAPEVAENQPNLSAWGRMSSSPNPDGTAIPDPTSTRGPSAEDRFSPQMEAAITAGHSGIVQADGSVHPRPAAGGRPSGGGTTHYNPLEEREPHGQHGAGEWEAGGPTLAQSIKSGIDKSPGNTVDLAYGVSRVKFKDGTQGILRDGKKAFKGGLGANPVGEKLHGLVARAMGYAGSVVPETVDRANQTQYQRYLEGAMTGREYLNKAAGNPRSPRQTEASENAVMDAWERVAETPEGRKLALLDYLTATHDRHDLNWLVKDGKPWGIDHEFAFTSGTEGSKVHDTSSPFAAMHAMTTFSPEEVQDIVRRLQPLEAQFKKVPKGADAFRQMMERVDALRDNEGFDPTKIVGSADPR